jgi:CHAT domain-containing protein/tetratricopeptide (TPR) repeat protein
VTCFTIPYHSLCYSKLIVLFEADEGGCHVWLAAVAAVRFVERVSLCPSLWLVSALVAPLLLGGCNGDSLAGIPSAAANDTSAAAVSSAVPAGLAQWDDKWRSIEVRPTSVALTDHWRVCEIKFRFRVYRDLFRCLDLIEARSDKDAREQRYAPVIIDWMRAEAYAELDEPIEALRWADSGWQALPESYQNGSAVYDRRANPLKMLPIPVPIGTIIGNLVYLDDFEAVAIEAGGSYWSGEGYGASPSLVGRHNPAGLDLRPQAIAMSLAAMRAIMHEQLGDTQLANVALRDLHKWKDSLVQANEFEITVSALSLGPSFAVGDYAGVVKDYEDLANQARREQSISTIGYITTLGLGYVAHKAFTLDAREFSVSLEDASRALIYAASLSRLGQTDRASKALDAILAAPEIRQMGSVYWNALYERSQIALKEGQRAAAISLLRRATDAIEQVRGSIAFEAGKVGFATSTQVVYEALVRSLSESGDWTGAFLASERGKARALVDLLAQVRELPPPARSAERVRTLLASATASDRDLGLPVNAQAIAQRGVMAAARAQLAPIAPEAASLVSVQTVPLDAIATRLAPDETLVSYFQAGDQLYAFIVSGAAVKGFRLNSLGLDDQVRAFRTAIEREDTAVLTIGQALYDRLLRPMEGELHGAALTISPHKVLHYLPFAALFDGQRYLADRYGLRMMPSASALVYLRRDNAPKDGRVLAFGNPDLGDVRFDLPGAQQEALAIAHLSPLSRALVRDQASKAAVVQLGGGFSMLHFATHGVFESDAPLTSGLLLARSAGDDGRLTVRDLYKLRLDADLVTLSGCDTALGKVAGGDDVIGLTRGFFYAGARTVVASLWEVSDLPTEKLMLSFYQNLATMNKREALQRAEIETRKTWAAPKFWAAFELSGSAN